MIVDCVSDLHGYYPELRGGDLLIVAGDLTATDSDRDWCDFEIWLMEQPYKLKIMIGGNHDNFLASMDEHHMWKYWDKIPFVTYLCDSGTEFEGLKIWGSPWTRTFEGMNPHCKAFTLDTEEELAEKWALIPDGVDIVVTHSPPFGLLDWISPRHDEKGRPKNVGSHSLLRRIGQIDHEGDGKERFLVCGHIHGARGVADYYSWKYDRNNWKIVNASYVDEVYEPYSGPVQRIVKTTKYLS